jgi:hypothetical protein
VARPTNQAVFIRNLADLGGRASNATLISAVGWDEAQYRKIHSELLEQGEIRKGKGRGGTVSLVEGVQPTHSHASEKLNSTGSTAILDSEAVAELALYDPAKGQLEKHWKERQKLYDFHVENTSMQGRRETGGSWSRPDLIVVGSKKYEFLREKVFELHTFEIKPATDITIKGVLEALAHREAATRAYVLYHTAGLAHNFPERARIENLAVRHGVGVYAAKTIADFSQWDEIVPAQRAAPDLDAIEQFIKVSLVAETQSHIRKWF